MDSTKINILEQTCHSVIYWISLKLESLSILGNSIVIELHNFGSYFRTRVFLCQLQCWCIS